MESVLGRIRAGANLITNARNRALSSRARTSSLTPSQLSKLMLKTKKRINYFANRSEKEMKGNGKIEINSHTQLVYETEQIGT